MKAVSLRVGPDEAEDASTLCEINRIIPEYYRNNDKQLIVFQAWITLTERGSAYTGLA